MKENGGCRMKDVPMRPKRSWPFARTKIVQVFVGRHNAEALMNSVQFNAANGVPAGPIFGFGVEIMPMD
jgi:hypothetical protein